MGRLFFSICLLLAEKDGRRVRVRKIEWGGKLSSPIIVSLCLADGGKDFDRPKKGGGGWDIDKKKIGAKTYVKWEFVWGKVDPGDGFIVSVCVHQLIFALFIRWSHQNRQMASKI